MSSGPATPTGRTVIDQERPASRLAATAGRSPVRPPTHQVPSGAAAGGAQHTSGGGWAASGTGLGTLPLATASGPWQSDGTTSMASGGIVGAGTYESLPYAVC